MDGHSLHWYIIILLQLIPQAAPCLECGPTFSNAYCQKMTHTTHHLFIFCPRWWGNPFISQVLVDVTTSGDPFWEPTGSAAPLFVSQQRWANSAALRGISSARRWNWTSETSDWLRQFLNGTQPNKHNVWFFKGFHDLVQGMRLKCGTHQFLFMVWENPRFPLDFPLKQCVDVILETQQVSGQTVINSPAWRVMPFGVWTYPTFGVIL